MESVAPAAPESSSGFARPSGSHRPPPGTPRTAARIWLEALAFWAITAIAIRLAVQLHLSDDGVAVVKSLALIYLPLGWMFATHRDLGRYAIQAPSIPKSLALFAIVSLVTLVPFWTGNHFWETLVLHHRWRRLSPPPGTLSLVFGEIFAVALPEEVFYRGYLQTRLDEALPKKIAILGAKIGWSLPITSVIFVAGHLAVKPALWQLSIFFPSLVFGWLRARSDSLVAPVLYHALCNVGMLILQRSYG